jgi:hypothetical protein
MFMRFRRRSISLPYIIYRIPRAATSTPHRRLTPAGTETYPEATALYIGWGNETEAACVTGEVKHIWWREDGAIHWLRNNAG